MIRSILGSRSIISAISKNPAECRRVLFSTESQASESSNSQHESIIDFVETIVETSPDENKSFATLLRHSKFMQLGDFNNRLVVGKITQRIQDDLYIDFGLKFEAVCKAPSINTEAYRSGARVLLRLHDPELSERFLGSNKDLTLLEADATLIRLLRYVPGAVRRNKPEAKKDISTGTQATEPIPSEASNPQ
ncbi:unnamed protein product [Caenorhabditis bovis]|uniref:Uncharacterized protein n=1 Tax=Caenorhabditis bovis TaxID=2654633 RepID=A0A8S1E9W6_9PELO|nr:unnamed protein product [Caenorhabditis bovis]